MVGSQVDIQNALLAIAQTLSNFTALSTSVGSLVTSVTALNSYFSTLPVLMTPLQVTPSSSGITLNSSQFLYCGYGSTNYGTAFAQATPGATGRLWVNFNGIMESSQAVGPFTLGMFFGTGTPPARGSSLQSGAVNLVSSYVIISDGAAGKPYSVPFAIPKVITGLTPGTRYWFDMAGMGPNGVVADLSPLYFTAMEI